MTASAPDLFPETLLVNRQGDHVFTTSRKVAEHFGKRHKNVIRSIEEWLADCEDSDSDRLNFEPIYSPDRYGRAQIEYRLTHDGFALLAMSFTGREARTWKRAFLRAFRAMEAELSRLREREAAALYHLRPRWQPIARHPDYNRQQLIALTGHASVGSITACRRRMRQAGLLEMPEGLRQSSFASAQDLDSPQGAPA